MTAFLANNSDYLIFVMIMVIEFALLGWVVTRLRGDAHIPSFTWILVVVILAIGWIPVKSAESEERAKVAAMMSCLAPTYALETARLAFPTGDNKAIPRLKPGDRRFERVIGAHQAWLGLNPSISQIFSVQKGDDGAWMPLTSVYAPHANAKRTTHDGAQPESAHGLESAWNGQVHFESQSAGDIGNFWVRATAPVYAPDGTVAAVLGVEYDAREWSRAISGARLNRIILVALCLGVVAAAVVAIGLLQADLAVRKDAEETAKDAEDEARKAAVEARSAEDEARRAEEEARKAEEEARRAEDEARKAEEEARKARERRELVIQQLPLVFIEWTIKNEIVTWNPAAAQIFGYSREEAVQQKGIDFLFRTQDREAVRAVLDELPASSGPTQGVYEGVTKSGGTVTCEWLHTPIVGPGGDVVAIMSLGLDISERKSLEEQMRQSQRLQSIGELAAGIAHDFNNLLTVIQGHTDLLLLRQDIPNDAIDDLDFIADAADRATKLTRQLLSFSRKQAMFPRPINLNEVVANGVQLLRRVLGENIDLRTDFFEAIPAIEADPAMIDQVLTNLAVNARDAMPDGGVLEVKTSLVQISEEDARLVSDATPGLTVCLRVGDSGCGMPSALLNRIFEPFFTTKQVGKGTGLGLSAVHGIVKQHKGWIQVISDEGEGTTFEIYFPATPDKVAVSVARERVVPREVRPSRSHTILLVEDEPNVRKYARVALERGGYDVMEAEDGVVGEKLYRAHQSEIALLLTDMVMPNGVSGYALAKRCTELNPDLPVVFASGYSVEFAAPDFKETETQKYLAKPFIPAKLLDTIRRLLGENAQSKPAITTLTTTFVAAAPETSAHGSPPAA